MRRDWENWGGGTKGTGESPVGNWSRTESGLGELGVLGEAGGGGARLEGGVGRKVKVGQDWGDPDSRIRTVDTGEGLGERGWVPWMRQLENHR